MLKSSGARLKVTIVALVSTIGAGTVAFISARQSIPKPPDDPTFFEILRWAISGRDIPALIAAILAGIGTLASLYQILGPKPATHLDVTADGIRTRDGLKHVSSQIQAEGRATAQSVAEILQEIKTLKAQLLAKGDAGVQQVETFAETATELAQSNDPRDLAIATEIVGGNPLDAADKLLAEGREGHAGRARLAARIYAPFDAAKAVSAYEEALALDETDVWAWIELARLYRDANGSLAAAKRAVEKALPYLATERQRMVAEGELGEICFFGDDLAAAANHFNAAMTSATKRVEATPNDGLAWQDLAVSHEKLGEVAGKSGDLTSAVDHFKKSLGITQSLSEAQPEDYILKYDFWTSLNKMGDIELASLEFDSARNHFSTGLEIAEAMARDVPGSPNWQRALLISQAKNGELALLQGLLTRARPHFENARRIAEQLREADPARVERIRDVFISQSRLALLLELEGDLVGAERAWTEAREISLVLTRVSPDHPGLAADLASADKALLRVGNARGTGA